MALTAGARVGPYEIVQQIGVGGMGEVYRARDPQLGRDVAIKILAPDLIGTRDAAARFEREARTASALNHPHIVHIYDIGDAQTSSGPTRYIAMEYVAGETLRTRLRNGAQWSDTVEHLAQVADALAKAHGAGIVHRDLKPDNVMVSFDGYVKVVDFGLAKLIEETTIAASSEAALLRSRPGAVVGTVGYMSPEQAQGLAVDGRSDIFALGCILYEVLAGRPPFKGGTALDILHAVVHDEPPSVDELSPQSPPVLRALAVQCLAKDPAKRPQAASEVARDLRGFMRGRETAATISVDRITGPLRSLHRSTIVWSAGAALVLIAAVAFGFRQRATTAPPSVESRPEMRFDKLTNRGDATNPAISPDGRYLAYAAPENGRQSIWLRDITDKTETRLVAGPGGPEGVDFWSVDFGGRGQTVYYSLTHRIKAHNAQLYRVPIIGGDPRLIREAPTPFELGVVSPDELYVAYRRTVASTELLVVADLDGGREIEVGDISNGRALAWSRDSKRLLFSRPADGGDTLMITNVDGTGQRRVGTLQRLRRAWWNDAGTVIVCLIETNATDRHFVSVDLATGETKQLGSRAWKQVDTLYWLPSGTHFVATDIADVRAAAEAGIWLVSYPDGKTVRLTADARGYWRLAMTADGSRLVTLEITDRSDLLIASDQSIPSFRRIVSGTDVSHSLCWTADGRIIYSSNEAGSYNLYVIDADGSNRRQLTFDRPGNETEPAASPDGKYIVFVSDRSGERGLVRMNADGTGLKSLTSPAVNRRDSAPQVTPDSQWIIYLHWNNGPTLWKMAIDGGTPTLIKGVRTVERDFEESAYGGALSPDGEWLTFFHFTWDPAIGRFSTIDVAVGSADGKKIARRFPFRNSIGINDDDRIQWSADGRAVYYARPRDGVTNLWKQPVDGRPGTWVTQFDEDLQDFDWSFDGKALAASREVSSQDIVMISNFVR